MVKFVKIKIHLMHFVAVYFLKQSKGIKSVYANDCLKLVKDENRFVAVPDVDAIKLCLLIIVI